MVQYQCADSSEVTLANLLFNISSYHQDDHTGMLPFGSIYNHQFNHIRLLALWIICVFIEEYLWCSRCCTEAFNASRCARR